MHISFTPHNTNISGSCKNVAEYLNKENSARENYFEELKEKYSDFEEQNFDPQLENQNKFFSNNITENKEIFYHEKYVTDQIDKNLSSRSKENESKFFIINVSPSKQEIDCLKQIAELELKQKFTEGELKILQNTEEGIKQIEVIRNDLVHQQLREYTKEIMKDYAENFNRQVYVNPDKLPDRKEELIINSKVKEWKKTTIINKKSDRYYKFLQKKRELEAKKLGKDLSTRNMNEKDLVWFGKIEEQRTYKGNDKWVIENRKLQKEINSIKETKNISEKIKNAKIIQLENRLNKDRSTGYIVREGMKKGGDQYHVHVIVSRYDNCPNKRYRSSISPLANQKNSKIAGKNAQVGFNRDEFFKKVEKTFDDKFKFERNQSYQRYNQNKKTRGNIGKGNFLSNITTRQIKNEVMKQMGLNELQKLNPLNSISKELGFSIPLSIPKHPAEIALKIAKTVINKVLEAGRGY